MSLKNLIAARLRAMAERLSPSPPADVYTPCAIEIKVNVPGKNHIENRDRLLSAIGEGLKQSPYIDPHIYYRPHPQGELIGIKMYFKHGNY